jgi:hypothetical protein
MDHGQDSLSLSFFDEMLKMGLTPNKYTYFVDKWELQRRQVGRGNKIVF